MNALYATPRVALVPLILIWFGIGMWSKVFIVFISAFFPVLVNTIGGMRAIDRGSAASRTGVLCFGLADLQDRSDSRVSALHPDGAASGVALGLIGVVVGEMFGGQPGHRLHGRRMVVRRLQTDTLFVGVVIIAVAGIILTWLAERLERRFSQWRPER